MTARSAPLLLHLSASFFVHAAAAVVEVRVQMRAMPAAVRSGAARPHHLRRRGGSLYDERPGQGEAKGREMHGEKFALVNERSR